MTGGLHDVLAPAGPQAAVLSHLWWLTLAACVLVFVAVLAAVAYGVWRAPRGTEGTAPDLALIDRSEPRLRRWVTVGVAVSTVLLLGLLIASFFTDRALARLPLADAPADYERWAEAQRRPAVLPTGDEARRGMELVVGSTCAMCHTIAGTRAQGRHAPDLTHVASRSTIGAGILPNNADTRAAWIVNPQAIKRSVNMPRQAFSAQDLNAINVYLTTLQ